jgi:hypothetical protein
VLQTVRTDGVRPGSAAALLARRALAS